MEKSQPGYDENGNRIIRNPTPQELAFLRSMVEVVKRQEEDAQALARAAVGFGMLLIGTTVSRRVHYPTALKNHTYSDFQDGQLKYFVDSNKPILRAGKNADLAVLGAIFGDFNDLQERDNRTKPFSNTAIPHQYGWGYDVYKGRREAWVHPHEYFVTAHAQPALINAARDHRKPFTGFIDCVYDDKRLTQVEHEPSQFVATIKRTTILSIPVVGSYDLPYDIVPTYYGAQPNLT